MNGFLKRNDRILIGGHRGCACSYPENSIKAMKEGIRRGADYLEIDVQLSKDEIPVIIHDVHLEDKTPLKGYVHQYTLDELKQNIDGLCTLQEALTWASARQVSLALELKSVIFDMHEISIKLAELLAKQLRETKMTRNVFVFGLDYQVLAHLKSYDKEIPIGIIAAHLPKDPVALMHEMDAIVYLAYLQTMTEKTVHDLQDHGFIVDASCLNDPYWIRRAKSLRVDMFESDDPAKAIAI
jgi:glycerophosphoryl diester phosphodiesterase